MMWKIYKKEIMEKETEEKDFLKKYYTHTHKKHTKIEENDEEQKDIEAEIPSKDNVFEEDDYPVQVMRNKSKIWIRMAVSFGS